MLVAPTFYTICHCYEFYTTTTTTATTTSKKKVKSKTEAKEIEKIEE